MEQLITGGIKPFETTVADNMNKHISFFEKELTKLRTGRAHTSLIENIKVECYGNLMPLKEVAAISTPEAHLFSIQPWDQSVLDAVERALQTADLGASPSNNGTIIRLKLPPMSTERRQQLVKQLKALQEKTKTAVRGTRKDFQNLIRKSEKDKNLSEDEAKKFEAALQKTTNTAIANIDAITTKKSNEITSI